MRNVSDKSCTENQNTHFMFDIFSNLSVYHITQKNNVRQTGHTWQYGACVFGAAYLSFYQCLCNCPANYHWSRRIVTDFSIKPY